MACVLDFFGGCPPIPHLSDVLASLVLVALAAGEGRKFKEVVPIFWSPSARSLEMGAGIVQGSTFHGVFCQGFVFGACREPPACGACEICRFEIVQTTVCFAVFCLVAITHCCSDARNVTQVFLCPTLFLDDDSFVFVVATGYRRNATCPRRFIA